MQTEPAVFGRRAQPHRIIVARGERIRALTLPHWAAWASVLAGCGLIAWLIGATAYIVFNDEIYVAARAHRVTVERAYEDRIASLRRQIDEINTRQFLDQKAFESRLEAALKRQAEIEERQQQIGSLVDDARQRKVTVVVDPSAPTVPEAPAPAAPRLARPAPLDAASLVQPGPGREDNTSRDGVGGIEDMEISLHRVETAQYAMLGTIEASVEDLTARLVEVVGAVGAEVPAEGADETGLGGPLVELRRLSTGIDGQERIDRIESGFDRLDMLRFQISRLPVRTPVEGPAEVTSGYGTRLDPFLRRPALHTGIDFRGQTGDRVLAAAGGRVAIADYVGGYGKMVEIDHGNGYSTRYGHMSRLLVSAGDNVAPGDVIGLIGTTGRSTGPHLHYETRFNGAARDPSRYVEAADLLPVGF